MNPFHLLNVSFSIQVPTLQSVEEKWKSVYKHLEVAPAGNMDQIFLTYSSGAGVLAHPRSIAQRVNELLYDYLEAENDLNQRLGIVCMDFPAAPIIQMIIDFQLRGVIKRSQTFNTVPGKANLKDAVSSLVKKMINK